MSFVIFTVVNCGNISKLNYSTIQSHTGNEYLDNVTYECIIGYYFVRNNVTLNTITCMADGNWSSIHDCIGVYVECVSCIKQYS